MEPAASSSMSNKWYSEFTAKSLYQISGLKKTHHWARSKFQELEILDLEPFGLSLVLDRRMQSASMDEWAYHECLVQPAMMTHPNPKTVFIGGGGEGATAREVLRHKGVEKCVMVDIDEEVVDICREHLKQHHDGVFDDPRLELHYEDAKKVLEEYPGKFDVIIFDLADPLEIGPCYLLYTVKFYEMVKTKMNPGAILVTQTGGSSIVTVDEMFTPIWKTLAQVFKHVYPSIVHVPSFADQYSFCLATDDYDNVANCSTEEIDNRINDRIVGGAAKLKFYDGVAHRGIHNVPKYVRTTYANEKRIITENTPLYVASTPALGGLESGKTE